MTWFFRIVFWGGLLATLFLLMQEKPENAAISWALYFGFYYGNRLWMRFILRRRKFALYFFTLAAAIIAIGTVNCALFEPGMYNSKYADVVDVIFCPSGFILLGLMQMVNFQVTVMRDWFHGVHVEEKLILTENALLKTELNPHLFKNMLNNIYSLVLQKKDEAADAIVKLKSFMEYMLYETNDKRVPLEKEINYIRDLVEIERLRLPENFNLTFQVTGNPDGKYIAPLVLLPFVENVFRHADLTSEKAFISISMKINGSSLEYEVKNKIPETTVAKKAPGGKGLNNLKARLKNSYSGLLGVPMYGMETRSKGSIYTASLEILDLCKPENN
ncbi:MAG: hypothetical protein KatS3mg080_1253 [Anoxybacillus sp.]|nr:MAG: hypothetical protein KatS3mg080_1253 [Anoxybacillus sp.]